HPLRYPRLVRRQPKVCSHPCLIQSRDAHECYSVFYSTPPPTDIYTLSLHDALPISMTVRAGDVQCVLEPLMDDQELDARAGTGVDRKSTRLNSSHEWISYAVFCLKKKNNQHKLLHTNLQLHQQTHS